MLSALLLRRTHECSGAGWSLAMWVIPALFIYVTRNIESLKARTRRGNCICCTPADGSAMFAGSNLNLWWLLLFAFRKHTKIKCCFWQDVYFLINYIKYKVVCGRLWFFNVCETAKGKRPRRKIQHTNIGEPNRYRLFLLNAALPSAR